MPYILKRFWQNREKLVVFQWDQCFCENQRNCCEVKMKKLRVRQKSLCKRHNECGTWNVWPVTAVIIGATGILKKMFKEKFGYHTRKILIRFSTKDSCTWNITHNTETTEVWNLKPERRGSPLVQEKYREKKACDHRYRNKNNNNNNNHYNNYTDLKKDLIRTCQLKSAYIRTPPYYPQHIFSQITSHGSLKMSNLRLILHTILMQKTLISNTSCKSIVTMFLAEQWMRSSWPLRPALFWEPANCCQGLWNNNTIII
jgi:hypothetical protein